MMGSKDKEQSEHLQPEHFAGVIYVACGARFVSEATLSATSVRRFLPGIPILLFTDQILEAGAGFDEVVYLSAPHPKPHINKIIAMTRSPFQKTLLLDTDTYVCADISDLFAMLDRFDIAMTHDRSYRDNFPADSGVPDAFVEFNQGVIVFRKTVMVRDVLQEALRWTERLHERAGKYPPDQPPFRIALFHSDLRIATLPVEYNCRFASYGYLNGVVKILHGRLPNRQMGMQDFERVASTLNRLTVPRVFLVGAVFAMLRGNRFGGSYRSRTLVGHLFRPRVALLGNALASLRRAKSDEGLAHWFRRMAKRLLWGQ
jgi:hypothetical protein